MNIIMKTETKIALAGAGIVALFAALKKNKSISGIGATGEFSPYVISWVFLQPQYGIATKHDEEILKRYGFSRMWNNVALGAHFPNKERAKEVLLEIANDLHWSERPYLDKEYWIYIMSDKQFGMIEHPTDRPFEFSDIYKVMTDKQRHEYKGSIFGAQKD